LKKKDGPELQKQKEDHHPGEKDSAGGEGTEKKGKWDVHDKIIKTPTRWGERE